MKKLIVFLSLFTLIGCHEEEGDLSGRYNFIEPPHPISRVNRLDNSEVAFDIIFTIRGETLTEVDMVVHAQQVPDASGNISGNNITFEGSGSVITLYGVRRSGQTLQASRASSLINGESKEFGALQVDPY